MHTAEALDDLITSFEQQGYRFVQLVPAPGAMAGRQPGSILQLVQPAPARPTSLLDRTLATLRDWGAHLAAFARWLAGAIGHLVASGLARLGH